MELCMVQKRMVKEVFGYNNYLSKKTNYLEVNSSTKLKSQKNSKKLDNQLNLIKFYKKLNNKPEIEEYIQQLMLKFKEIQLY